MEGFPIPAKYVPARRNDGKILVDNNSFEYNLVKKVGLKTWWICGEKTNMGCKVTATVKKSTEDDDDANDVILAIRGEHEHDSDLLKKVAMSEDKKHVHQAASNLSILPRSVMANITSDLQNTSATRDAVNVLPKRFTIAKQIQRARHRELDVPKIPTTWQETVVPDALSRTASGDQFLILDVNIEEHRPEKILGFASPEGIDIMKDCTQMYGDGTFAVVEKTLFFQLFVIISTTQTGINVPTAFFLLPCKEAIAYKKALECLKNLDIDDPPLFHCDFESAIIKSVKDVFSTTRILCCDTHFKRALRTNLQKHHLLAASNTDTRLQQFVRYIWALSLVPVEDILAVWTGFVCKHIPEVEDDEWPNVEPGDLDDFAGYVENTYVGPLNKRTGKRQNPKFRHQLWNKNEAILNGEDLTTNSSEGYNLQLKMSIPKNANLWKLIHSFIKEDSLISLKLRDHALEANTSSSSGGTSPTTAREAARLRRKQELQNLVSKYNTMSIKSWMKMVVSFYTEA